MVVSSLLRSTRRCPGPAYPVGSLFFNDTPTAHASESGRDGLDRPGTSRLLVGFVIAYPMNWWLVANVKRLQSTNRKRVQDEH
jgi:hypothetical protein